MRTLPRRLIAFLALTVVFLVVRVAASYVPPPIQGHVTDEAGKLSASERTAIDKKLEDYRLCSTNEIAVLVAASLRDENIEDVAFATFNTWKVGLAGHDNGVLLVIAPSERRVRIETGKNVGGNLTDLESWNIIETQIGPRLKVDAVFSAIDAGTTAIGKALGGCAIGSPETAAAAQLELETRRERAGRVSLIRFLSIGMLVVTGAMSAFAFVSRRRREAAIALALFVLIAGALALQIVLDAWAPAGVAWIAMLPVTYWLMATFAKIRGWKATDGPGGSSGGAGGSSGGSSGGGGGGGGSSYSGGGGSSGGGGASGSY